MHVAHTVVNGMIVFFLFSTHHHINEHRTLTQLRRNSSVKRNTWNEENIKQWKSIREIELNRVFIYLFIYTYTDGCVLRYMNLATKAWPCHLWREHNERNNVQKMQNRLTKENNERNMLIEWCCSFPGGTIDFSCFPVDQMRARPLHCRQFRYCLFYLSEFNKSIFDIVAVFLLCFVIFYFDRVISVDLMRFNWCWRVNTHISNLIIFSVLFFLSSHLYCVFCWVTHGLSIHTWFLLLRAFFLWFFSNTMLKYDSILYPSHSMCSPWTRFFPVRIILMWAHQEYYV